MDIATLCNEAAAKLLTRGRIVEGNDDLRVIAQEAGKAGAVTVDELVAIYEDAQDEWDQETRT